MIATRPAPGVIRRNYTIREVLIRQRAASEVYVRRFNSHFVEDLDLSPVPARRMQVLALFPWKTRRMVGG